MAIQERVTEYSVATLRNDIVAYRRIIRLTTETGHRAFLAFPVQPPAEWLTVSGPTSNVFLEADEFDRVYHLLQSEAPVFYTAMSLLGIRAFNLTTTDELPGEGSADDDALAALAAGARAAAHAA
jgi:hypothetical protein